MLKRLKKNEYELLKRNEKILTSAYQNHTMNNLMPDERDEMYKLYLSLGYQRISIGCGRCVISMLTTLYAYLNNENKIRIRKKDDGESKGNDDSEC